VVVQPADGLDRPGVRIAIRNKLTLQALRW
jgi:hypothetical protein